ncbi:matrixin family metalloprotease [Candidatus Microgenomates bacterium]|nr:matrixin family metalloprotease [Candidatus Microgenomates bacterium]
MSFSVSKITTAIVAFTLLILAVFPASAAPSKRVTAPSLQWVEEVFVDYGADTHAGPGPHPTTESNSFHLTQGGIKWFAGGMVEYKITGTEAVSGGNTAIVDAEDIVDGFIITREFSRDDSTAQENLCTGDPNTVQWTAIDGEGGALASARVCRNVATKEIGGFVITIDTSEPWSVGDSPTTYDVQNALTHEWLHVAGLDHTNAPKDGCLTSYRFAGLGETQKRTLGLGDKLGMDVLYSTGNTSPGPGCSN